MGFKKRVRRGNNPKRRRKKQNRVLEKLSRLQAERKAKKAKLDLRPEGMRETFQQFLSAVGILTFGPEELIDIRVDQEVLHYDTMAIVRLHSHPDEEFYFDWGVAQLMHQEGESADSPEWRRRLTSNKKFYDLADDRLDLGRNRDLRDDRSRELRGDILFGGADAISGAEDKTANLDEEMLQDLVKNWDEGIKAEEE